MNRHSSPYDCRGGSEARPYENHRPERQFGDFTCSNCGGYVSARAELSGVQNRNHCPYCLASRHVDLWQAGDRLSACKALMHPLGLTIKQVNKKYAAAQAGELMLIHHCEGCGKLSLNRIAADDDVQTMLEVFRASLKPQVQELIASQQVIPLNGADLQLVRKRLLGWN
jgi:hypothetical protein